MKFIISSSMTVTRMWNIFQISDILISRISNPINFKKSRIISVTVTRVIVSRIGWQEIQLSEWWSVIEGSCRTLNCLVNFFQSERFLFFRSENPCLMMIFYFDIFHRIIEFTITKLKEFIQRISKIFSWRVNECWCCSDKAWVSYELRGIEFGSAVKQNQNLRTLQVFRI